MCEPIDCNLTFCSSQVRAITCHLYTVTRSLGGQLLSVVLIFISSGGFVVILLWFFSLKMGTLFASRNPFRVKLVNNVDFLMFLHF